MMQLLETVLRTTAAFILIMIIARTLGKQTIAQMTYHDFVAAITLGAITSNLAFNITLKPLQMVASLFTFSGIVLLLAFIALKSRSARKWISGQPTVVIQNGKILENNLKKLRLTLDTLNQELREKDIFDMEEVEYAILELNGRVSVLKKPEYRQVTRKDLKIFSPQNSSFPVELIMDGKSIDVNLRENHLSKEWLNKELNNHGYKLEQVNYAVKGTNGTLFFDLFKDHIQQPIDKE